MNDCIVINGVIYTEDDIKCEAMKKFNSLMDSLLNIK